MYRRLEDLVELCWLHIAVSGITHRWPAEERYELGPQARRASNSAAAQLAEKYDDRHVRNKIEGVNRSQGEAAETVHHLYMAHLKGYESKATYDEYRARYQECIRMLNGMERTLEKHLPDADRRWPPASVREDHAEYDACPEGFPESRGGLEFQKDKTSIEPLPDISNPEPFLPNP